MLSLQLHLSKEYMVVVLQKAETPAPPADKKAKMETTPLKAGIPTVSIFIQTKTQTVLVLSTVIWTVPKPCMTYK